MMKPLFITVVVLAGLPAAADTVVAARTIRAQSILTVEDVTVIDGDRPGTFVTIDEVVGLEARVMLYSGRPISTADIGPAAIVERNQIVSLVYNNGGLTITADARALGRAGPGDMLRVMNLSSKTTVSGVVAPDGSVHVGGLSSH